MDDNTLRIVASNLTVAFYSINKLASEKVQDSQTKEMHLPEKVIIQTYRAILSQLVWEEKEIDQHLTQLRQSQ